MNISFFTNNLQNIFENFLSTTFTDLTALQDTTYSIEIFPNNIEASDSSTLYCFISLQDISVDKISTIDSMCSYKVIVTFAAKQKLVDFVMKFSDVFDRFFDFVVSTFYSSNCKISEFIFDEQSDTSICTFEFMVAENLQ
jgi:hypothetical protein